MLTKSVASISVVQNVVTTLLEAGREKYGKFNCLQPFDDADERFWDATIRHLQARQRVPLAIDEETGCLHGAAAAFNILMRLHHCRQAGEARQTKRGERG